MTRKLTRDCSLIVIAAAVAILALLIVAAVRAQVPSAEQPSGKSNAVLATPGTSASAQAERPLTPWTDGTGRFPVGRSQTKRHGARPLGSPPLFLPGVTFSSGGVNAMSIAVADVNGDGKPDVVVANAGSGTVGVLLGNGDGTFLPAVTYSAGGCNSSFVAVADVNGDGKPDIVVSSQCEGTVSVLLGNGDGTFQPAVTYGSGGPGAAGVAVADVNHDGRPDLVVANGGGENIGVLLGNGDGTFQPAVTYGSGGQSWSVTIADVNGDGNPDLLVANAYTLTRGNLGNVAVLLGNGDGTFQPAVTYGSGGFYPASIAVADVNGDKKPDLVVANCGTDDCLNNEDGVVGVLLGNGDGTFQPAVDYDSGGYITYGVAIADVNGDGKPDILVTNETSYTVGVLLGNGDGTFQAALTFSINGDPTWIVLADVNGDGLPDVVLACDFAGSVGVLLHSNPTTTTLVSSLNPSVYGQAVTFTAAVSAASGTPTGTVIFYDGSTALGSATLANGSASLSTSSLAIGSHSITAAYQGVGTFLPSTSAPLIQVVNGIPTTTLLVSSANPSVYGQTVTFTAAVSAASGTPTGTVIFYDGSTAIGNVTLANGSASLSISSLSGGPHSITAAYQGSGAFDPSTSTLLNQVVNPATTSTSLVSSANPARVKQRITYTATVTSQYGGAATGTVTFQDNGAMIATVALSGNQAAYSTSYAAKGVHLITATYSGDANNAGSISPVLTEDVGKPPFPSETTLATSGSPSQLGQPVTFTATVTSKYGAIPDGELVTFYDGKTAIGTGVTASGVATFTTSSLTAKKHVIKATYAGDAQFKPSSGKVTQVVEK